ncbi:MAG: hypothetical protein KDD50_07640 [Bdellovibrionales bacterium]|nr:hypothetical protein [Bdellovibrionales bacterium]
MLVRSRTYRFLYSFGGLFFKFCTVVIFLGSLFVACNKSPQTKIVKEPAGRDGGGGNPRKPQPDKFIGYVKNCVEKAYLSSEKMTFELRCSPLFKTDNYPQILTLLENWTAQNCPDAIDVNGSENKKFVVEPYKPLLMVFYKEELVRAGSETCQLVTTDQYGNIREK